MDPLYVVEWVIDVLDETRREAWRGCEGRGFSPGPTFCTAAAAKPSPKTAARPSKMSTSDDAPGKKSPRATVLYAANFVV